MREKSLLEAIAAAAAKFGSGRLMVEDSSGASLTYRQLFIRGFALSSALKKLTHDEKNIGVMMPSCVAAIMTITTVQLLGKTPAMLNFSAGVGNLQHGMRIACARTILTSRKFVALGKLDDLIAALASEFQIIYMEDLKSRMSLTDKISAIFKSFFPRCFLPKTEPDDVAAILYTSGSEGAPKGVALSHRNILANVEQVCMQLPLSADDRLFNPLPVFHSFGFTVGVFLPLIIGMRQFQFPSPLRYKEIPPLVAKSKATIFLGADTFYQGYAKTAAPNDFSTVRLAVAGAEKLKESTRQLYQERFGVAIYQGYGVTETSPVISVNVPEANRLGTVGQALYGISTKIEPVEGIERGGRLLVSGDNVMLGYIKADQPGVIQPQGDWYDTGDIVDIDDDGFITILGRAKRFAKIGGEMVSLAVVEELALSAAPEHAHAAVAVPCDKKGEQITLFTECPILTREQLIAKAKEGGISELHLPRTVAVLDALPRLGSGKVDYISLKNHS